MPDTPRTLAEVLALFADNATGNISEQDLRDFVVSLVEPVGGGGFDTIAPPPLFSTGQWYGPYHAGSYSATAPSTSAANSNNLVCGSRFWAPRPTTFDRIGLYLPAAGDAGATLRLGIYEVDGATSLPGALVLDTGTIAADTIGFKEFTISQALHGQYALVAKISGLSATNPQWGALNVTATQIGIPGWPQNTGTNNVWVPRWTRAGVTGALPDPAGMIFSGGNPPLVQLRAA